MSIYVLLIEHDLGLRTHLGSALRAAGFLVMALDNADEAIDLVRLVTFDLVLADVGTLRYAQRPPGGLTALVSVLRRTRLLCFTSLRTMGPEGGHGAPVLGDLVQDVPQLLQTLSLLLSQPTSVPLSA